VSATGSESTACHSGQVVDAQADLWLGFAEADVEAYFAASRLVEYGYASLRHHRDLCCVAPR